MNCWVCDTELIWGGDHDDESEVYLIETNLSCPNCEASVIVWHGKGPNYDEYRDEIESCRYEARSW